MKAQFKYAFLAGLHVRGVAFAVLFVMNVTFITLGSLGLLPLPVLITAVSLGGIGIAAMLAANIGGDVFIARRMFAVPDAYLHALTPIPRWKTLLASITAMTAMDLFTMIFVIASQVWLVFNLVGGNIAQMAWDTIRAHNPNMLHILWFILALIACYLLVVMIILFCVTAKKSFLFKLPASGFLAFLLACGCFYAVSVLQLVLAPISEVQRFGFLIMITPLSSAAYPVLIILTLLEAAALFVITSKLMERRINL